MTVEERQARANVLELQEMAIHRADDVRQLKYRVDDLAMALKFIVKRVTLESFTAKEADDFIKTMERVQKALERK